jgi:hypothetical protein
MEESAFKIPSRETEQIGQRRNRGERRTYVLFRREEIDKLPDSHGHARTDDARDGEQAYGCPDRLLFRLGEGNELADGRGSVFGGGDKLAEGLNALGEGRFKRGRRGGGGWCGGCCDGDERVS